MNLKQRSYELNNKINRLGKQLEKISNIAANIHQMNLLSQYTINEIIIVILKHGIVTNYKCNTEYIAKLLNRDTKEIAKRLNIIRIKDYKSEDIICSTVSAYLLNIEEKKSKLMK